MVCSLWWCVSWSGDRMGGRTPVVLLLTVMAVRVCSTAQSGDDGSVILSLNDSFTKEVKNQIRVRSQIFPGNLESYAAYLTVNDTVDINLFFWLCRAKKGSGVPLLLWLNGGPSLSSMMGAMLENGPYELHEDGTVSERTHAWTNEFHVLYVDSPVGTGYSFSSQNFVEQDMDGIVQALYKLLYHMNAVMFPEYFQNGLYIGGQSYAGKYVPALGKLIHDRNQQESVVARKIPMKGIYIGNGLLDAKTMLLQQPDTLYYAGLISWQNREDFYAVVMDFISKPFELEGMGKVFAVTENATANHDLNNLLAPEVSLNNGVGALLDFMNWEITRQAFHVGNASGSRYAFDSDRVANPILINDFFVDTVEENKLLMDSYKVLQYTGNLDMLISVAMTEAFLDQVAWAGRDRYRASVFTKWEVDHQMLGWFVTVDNFTRVVVRNSGHNVPFDQPLSALEMMKSFVLDQPPFRVQEPASSGADRLPAGLKCCYTGVLAALLSSLWILTGGVTSQWSNV